MSAKKVTAFVGSARKGHTYDAVVQFLNNLQSMGDIEVEIVRLSDYRLEVCRGCKLCFDRGEEHCPLKDDRDVLIEKMMASDGVIFASPNYSFQVSGDHEGRSSTDWGSPFTARAFSARPLPASSPRASTAATRSSTTWISWALAWASTP